MTLPVQRPTSFELALLANQISRREALCPEADEIHILAANAIFKYGSKARTPLGGRVLKTPGYPMTVDGHDINLHLMAEHRRSRTMEAWRMLFEALREGQASPNDSTIVLAINGDFHQQAALILPPREGHGSASVVVGTIVNDPEYMEQILPIVSELANPSSKGVVNATA